MSGEKQGTGSVWTFARHYLEMVLAMMLGMVVLGVPVVGILEVMGTGIGELEQGAPAVYLLGMATVMTIPMVAWMRYRGHGWRPSGEMAGAMFAPTFVCIGLMAAGVVTDFHALLMIQHIAMGPSMLGVMLARWSEYATPHGRGIRLSEVAA